MIIPIMKKVYFVILSTIIIGFVIGVIFELDRRNSTPKELIDRIPQFMEDIFNPHPPTTTIKSKRDNLVDISKIIVQRENMMSEIERNLKQIRKTKDSKKKEELCKKVFNIRKVVKQIGKNISIKDDKFIKSNQKEFRKIVNKIRKNCHQKFKQDK